MTDKELLKEVFSHLTDCSAWSLQLIRIKPNKSGIVYVCRETRFSDDNSLLKYLGRIKEYYCSPEGIEKVSSVDDYNGDIIAHSINKIDSDNVIISDDFAKLMEQMAAPDREMPLGDLKPNAVAFLGNVVLNGNNTSVILFSIQRPITTLTNKYLMLPTGTFREIEGIVLSLQKTIDVAVIGNAVYLFASSGEKLFNIERAYKQACRDRVLDIIRCNFISDTETFWQVATTGRNPRRFLAYNEEHCEWLQSDENRKRIHNVFGIELDGDKIDTSKDENVERLVKFLCDKAMLDICSDLPKEVSATKPWR